RSQCESAPIRGEIWISSSQALDGRNRHLFDDRDTESFERSHALGMVGEQADRTEVEIGENLRAYAYLALRLALMGCGGSGRRFALMGFAMEDQSLFRADAEPLGRLMQVDQRAGTFARDHLQRAVEDDVAIAKRSAENVAGQAVGVHADQDR